MKRGILLFGVCEVGSSVSMSRTSRASRGGFVYHVLNRGNVRLNLSRPTERDSKIGKGFTIIMFRD
jgi:hypothetical protein